jgi:dihydrofolate synthase/folylpolyglutamate synthase
MEKVFSELEKFGIRPGLERIGKLMALLGHPEQKMKVVLVTGTNGKGSVTSFLAYILTEAGYKTGSYFSPSLVSYNERFKIDGNDINDTKLKRYEKLVLELRKKKKLDITEFEALTAVAYKYFANENCDFAVMEIGMGGRLDATNIADECLSIITNVDLEHTEYLGKTIEQVTFEKAGVMKKGVAITGAEDVALQELKRLAGERDIRLRVLKEDFFAKPKRVTAEGNEFSFLGHEFYDNLHTSLLGRHQINNAALAVAAAEELGIEGDAIWAGLKKAQNPGRLEVINRNPLVVLDGAHNLHGVKELIGNLSLFGYDRLICIFGVMKDKDWKAMLKLLGPHCDLLIANETKLERAAKAKEVAAEAAKYCETLIEPDVKKSFALAQKKAKKKDLVLVCGSLYMLGELLRKKESKLRKTRHKLINRKRAN